jgi:hypothetical protein
MTQYLFDAITPGQAPLLESTDTVVFHGGPARLAAVSYDGFVTPAFFATTISFNGHTVSFDPGLYNTAANRNLIFDDGSNLIIGGPRDEAYSGSIHDDGLYGGDGADTLDGLGGDNFIHGNQGDDRLLAGAGADTILGGQGDDIIRAGLVSPGEAGNFVHGNLGNDTIAGGDGPDILLGGQGNDVISAGHGLDYLNGNLGNDRLMASGGVSSLLGEAGTDTLEAAASDCFLIGGAGADLFQIDVLDVGGPTRLVRESILDWELGDRLTFTGVRADHTYAEATVQDPAIAVAAANALLRAGARPGEVGNGVVAIQIPGEVLVFADSFGDSDADADAFVRLVGRTLADIAPGDFI